MKRAMRAQASACRSFQMPVSPGVDAALGRHRGGLGNDRRGAADRAAAQVHQVPVVRHAVGGRVLAHRRHHDAVAQGQRALRERIEQAGQGDVSGQGGGTVNTGSGAGGVIDGLLHSIAVSPSSHAADRLPIPASRLGDLPRAPLWVGLSGGLDSSVLLHLLAHHAPARAAGLHALHVHHGLHSDADAWAEHCVRLCSTLAIELTMVHVKVTRDGGDGLEAAARDARHAAFAATLGDGDVLALGSPSRRPGRNLPAARAARLGPGRTGARCGAGGRFGAARLWRPLLDTARADLLAYARATRPGVDRGPEQRRHGVRPQLPAPTRAAAAARALAAGGRGVRAVQPACMRMRRRCSTTVTRIALAGAATVDPHCVSATALQRLPVARRARVLRRWIAALGLPPLPAQGVARIETDLLAARVDAESSFAWQGVAVTRWRDLLHAGRQYAALPRDWRRAWDGHGAADAARWRATATRRCRRPRLALRAARPAAAANASPCPAAAIRTRSSTCCRTWACRPGSARACRCCPTPTANCWPPATWSTPPASTAWLREQQARLLWTPLGWRRRYRARLTASHPPPHTSPMARKTTSEASPVADFEQSLDALEQLVEKMEHGEMSLEDSLAAYERGVGLYRRCQTALEQAELRVRLLSDPQDPAGGRALRGEPVAHVRCLIQCSTAWRAARRCRARPGPARSRHQPATPARGDAPCGAARRQAHATVAGVRQRGARVRHRRTRARRARRRGRADPRLFAGARRPAGDGRRRPASRPADRACRIRRGHRDPRRRRAAIARIRSARGHAGQRCRARRVAAHAGLGFGRRRHVRRPGAGPDGDRQRRSAVRRRARAPAHDEDRRADPRRGAAWAG